MAVREDHGLSELYASHWAELVRLGTLLLRDQARAEEVAQDAFVHAYPRLGALSRDGTALAYLRRAVVNGCRSHYRHADVERRYVAAAAAQADALGRRDEPSAEAQAVRHDTDAALLGAVHRLPEKQREVLVLRYYADLSEQQIADALGISAGSVKTHAHRALTTLRTMVGETA